jgi:hypothetical protein
LPHYISAINEFKAEMTSEIAALGLHIQSQPTGTA